ncbi:hypothetical protein GCM10011581_42990 [Saccharopolyspora subtropica]|uniref:Uncharacterized protein n=1 Tax=Saccharopolyspora thermophila TaxID=89367 RepID=A0A917K839_9PSEU|nr:hypothetical protein GCM10011581_42990 [Saccharopolyspora subtropica]
MAAAFAALVGVAGCGGSPAPAPAEAARPAFPGAPLPGLAAQPAWQGTVATRGEDDFGAGPFRKVVGVGDVFAFLGDRGQQEVLLFLDPATGRERASVPVPSDDAQSALEPAEVGGRPVVVLTYSTTTPETTMTAAQEQHVTEVYDAAARLVWREVATDGSPGHFRNGWVLRSEQVGGVDTETVHDLQGRPVWTAGEPTIAGRQRVVGVYGDVLLAQYGDDGELVAYRLSPTTELWRGRDVAPPGEEGPAEAPDVVGFADGRVLIHWQLGVDSFALAAHDPASGAIAWWFPVERGHRWSGFHQELTYDPVSGIGAVHSDQGATVVDVRGGRLLWENADGDRAFRVTAVTGSTMYGLVDEKLPVAVSTEQKRPLAEGLTALPVASAGGYAWATRGPGEHWVFKVE